MIEHPVLVTIFLVLIEITILGLAGRERLKKYFQFLPSIFWIYFLPMVASTLGWVAAKSPVYQAAADYLLPASLFLLLVTVDIKAIARLGRLALLMFFAGSAGIVLGAPLVFFVFKEWVGREMGPGFGALAGSWTGGSANMIAVKEAMGTPDEIFLPMVIVDTVVPYVWMGTLVALVTLQPYFDRWSRPRSDILDHLGKRVAGITVSKAVPLRWHAVLLFVMMAGLTTVGARFLGQQLPVIKNVMSAYTWTIMIVSTAGIVFSFTPLKTLGNFGADKVGYFLLYFVLTTIGAKANVSHVGTAFALILAGFCLVVFHAAILTIAAKLLRAPMFLVAVASQANIGGVASAPVVAEIYQPGLASVGLLLAICGNIVGTYLGIAAGQLCRLVSGGPL